jgi:transketolase
VSQNIGGFKDVSLYGAPSLGLRSYGAALFAAAQADPRIVCLGADLTQPTETYLMRDGLPNQFVSLGIQEANMIGVAAGMARCGDIPFAHSFCVFATRRVYDQIAMQLAYPRTNVKIVGFMPGLTTPLGVSHQAIDDIALMRTLPNMVVIEPSGPSQIQAAVQAAIDHFGPVYLRLQVADGSSADDNSPLSGLSLGRGELLAEGADVAIVASGVMVAQALKARRLLSEKGVSATVANIHTLKPFDQALVLQLAARHKALVTAENHSVIGGLGAAVAECLALNAVPIRFGMIGIQDCFAEGGTTSYLMRKYGLDAAHIATKAEALCGD